MEKEELIQLIEGPIYKAYANINHIKDDITSISNDNTTNSRNTSNSSSRDTINNSDNRQISLSEAQRDRRTVFVQQLSVRCTDRILSDFFNESACPVRNSRIVMDKYTRKSKGVAYVEFFEEETVRAALKLTGKKVLGVPVIVELTETEKNRIAQEAAILNAASTTSTSTNKNTTTTTIPATTSDDLIRLYVGSLHPSLSESELEQLFEPFGELESVELLKDERSGASKGVAFIQYKKIGAARRALESLNGFELAGRAIRVGPVRVDPSKITKEKENPALPSQKGVQKSNLEVDEEENITLDAGKRAELMQKLLSSRK